MRNIVRKRILKKFNYKCVNCGSREKLEIDHIIPLSRGGSDDEINRQVLCRKCNRKKGVGIDFNRYFKKGDGKDYVLISRDFPVGCLKENELNLILDKKFKELCK